MNGLLLQLAAGHFSGRWKGQGGLVGAKGIIFKVILVEDAGTEASSELPEEKEQGIWSSGENVQFPLPFFFSAMLFEKGGQLARKQLCMGAIHHSLGPWASLRRAGNNAPNLR